MDLLEEPTRLVIEAYRRRFNDPLDLPVHDFNVEKRSRLVAALERALQRNLPLFDYELQEFEVPWRRRVWLSVRRFALRLAARRTPML
ncbi:MAG: hypothetical protein KJZ80_09035 [Hyphomicrobiaceae bacterium]|nr:hypothetical protein [Hyphomicrobiaceae bacterium]